MKKSDQEIKPSRKGFVTNYPHFRYWKKPAVRELLTEPPVNLYLHIPFCAQKCAYCYYKTERYKSPAQLEEYAEALSREIEMASRQFKAGSRPVSSIYIGGGTPSLLSGEGIKKIAGSIREHFKVEDPEFTLEAEPRTITPAKVSAWKEIGINRISIGIQSFNDEIVRISGRAHTREKALGAIKTIQDAGGIVINIDLLSGLAGETPTTWSQTLETAIGTQVHNITVYRMEAYLNTEFFKKSVRKKEMQLPTEEQELELMKIAIEKFAAADYRPWCFFTFSPRGQYRHRYVTNLWKGEDCLAFGPSGFGALGTFSYQNTNDMDVYRENIEQGQLPIVRAHRLTGKDIMVRDLLLGMKLTQYSRQDYKKQHGYDVFEVLAGVVSELQAGGYIQLDREFVTLTDQGVLYGDYVGKRMALALKQYLGPDEFSMY